MNESQTFSPPARSPLFFFLSFSLQPTYRRAARAYPFLHGFILSCTGLSLPARVYPSLHTPSGIIQMCFSSSVRGGRTGHMINQVTIKKQTLMKRNLKLMAIERDGKTNSVER